MLRLHIAHLCTKHDHSSFSRSRDMAGANQNLNGSGDMTTPSEGRFVIRGLALATINLSTKFHPLGLHSYEKRYKISKIGWFGVFRSNSWSLKLAPFDRVHTSSYRHSIVSMSLSCTVPEIYRHIGRKSLIVTHATPIWCPVGVSGLEFRHYH